MSHRLLLTVSLVGFVTSTVRAQDISTMLQRVPGTANVVAAMDITGLMQSDVGSREGWTQKRTMDFYSGRVPFPPSAKILVSASEFNPLERKASWQIALMHFGEKVDPYVIAKKEGSQVDWIDKLVVIPTRRNAYFVEFDRQMYGSYSPANRQQLAKWVQFAKDNKPTGVSPYLIDNVQKGSGFGQFTIVMDLSHFIDKAEVYDRLDKSKVFADAKGDAKAWAGFIAGIKGLRLSVRATDRLSTELQFDFSEDAKPYEQLFPALLEEIVQKIGLGIQDIGNWKCRAMNHSVTLHGTIAPDEVRHLIALVVPLAPNTEIEQEGVSAAQSAVTTSQRYFRAIDSMLKDLRKKSDVFGSRKQWQANANWHEQMAAKIDQLPNVHADPELIEYAATVTGRIRVMAESLRGVNVQDKVLDTYRRYGYDWGYGGGGYGWGGYYGGGYSDNKQQVESAKAEQAAAGAKERNALWRMIGDDTTKIRQTLAQKYNAEF